MRDQYNRKINYMRISVTDRCNLRCQYCMPCSGIDKKAHETILRHEEILKIVDSAAELGVNKIRLTGGEPLIRKGIESLIADIKAIDGINELTLTTNGVLLYDKIEALKAAGLTRINLSLDTLKADRYSEITRGGCLEDVLKCIPKLIEENLVPLKINVVLIGGFNDDEIVDFVELTRHQPIEVRFIELMPIGEASIWNQKKFISNDVVLEKINLTPIKREESGSPAKYYQLEGGIGKVGLINPISCNFCEDCNRIRITSDGKIKPCLHSDQEIDILTALREGKSIKPILMKAVFDKPEKHLINEEDYKPIKRNMNRIGG